MTHAEVSDSHHWRKWKLPVPIQEAAAWHHAPGHANGGALHLAHAVGVADHYVNTAGLGMPPYRRHPALSFDDCDANFGLKERAIEAGESFQAEFEAVRSFF